MRTIVLLYFLQEVMNDDHTSDVGIWLGGIKVCDYNWLTFSVLARGVNRYC